MKPVLLTGFEPFGGDRDNPSQGIVERLDGCSIGGITVIGRVLPCVFYQAPRVLEGHILEHSPGLVICLGVAGGRSEITPERVAINVDDARIPDNAGQQPANQPIVPGGPVGYWSSLPICQIVTALRAQQFPASISDSAGTFVCNHTFYTLCHRSSQYASVTQRGFIHVPNPVEETSRVPGMSLDDMVRGIQLAIATCLESRLD